MHKAAGPFTEEVATLLRGLVQDQSFSWVTTLRLSSMLRATAVCRDVKGTVVPRNSDTVVPADLAAASTAGAGAALGMAGAAGAAAVGAAAVLGPAQQGHCHAGSR